MKNDKVSNTNSEHIFENILLNKRKFLELNKKILKKNKILNEIIVEKRKNHIYNDNIKIINNFENYSLKKTKIIKSFKFVESINEDKNIMKEENNYDISFIIKKKNYNYNLNSLNKFNMHTDSKDIKNVKINKIKNYLKKNYIIFKKNKNDNNIERGKIRINCKSKIINKNLSISNIKL